MKALFSETENPRNVNISKTFSSISYEQDSSAGTKITSVYTSCQFWSIL